ncbi:(deoxy)nucleoside triphosphate pyrophosphohydrolase [Qipengyuania pelagi]|jgi:8-oxo-dGTP diphosphatase|uniref:8-oxo-dGTP diphosphatase n=1 Tax=Qipengyuania pelagi TaxID=994320 RepID=A0A844Y777_9SPHN|nr:NUDIX domain-containing protein [Qipengyuania pelagi]
MLREAAEVERNPTWLCVVAGLLIDPQGRWLMHRRPWDKAHGGLWEFPGGKVEPGETPEAALVRELGEELDISIDPRWIEPLAFASEGSKAGGRPITLLLYLVRQWEGTPRAVEGGAIGWNRPDAAAKLEKPPLDVALFTKARALVPPAENAAGRG